MDSYIKGRMQAKGIWKQDPEANIWAQEGRKCKEKMIVIMTYIVNNIKNRKTGISHADQVTFNTGWIVHLCHLRSWYIVMAFLATELNIETEFKFYFI